MDHLIGRDDYYLNIINPFLENQNETVQTLYLYGDGGIGKTTILRDINKRYSATLSVELVDFADENYHNSQVVLRILADTIEQTLRKPIFKTYRIADEIYGVKNNHNIFQQKKKKHLITELENSTKNKFDFLENIKKHFEGDFFETIALFKDVALEGVKTVSERIPIWKTITTGANSYYEFKDFKEKVQITNNNEKLKALKDLQHSEIKNQLIEFFIDDVNQSITQEDNLVLLIDTFETLWKPNEYTEYNYSTFDKWIRKLINETNHVKWIIAGRNYLIHWEEDKKLKGKVRQQKIGEFEDEEAVEYLVSNGIKNDTIMRFIIQKSKIPAYLHTCVEYYKSLTNPSIADFEEISHTTELLLHQLMHINEYEGGWLERLCMLPYINSDIIGYLQRKCSLRKISLHKFPFIEKLDEHHYHFTPFIKENLVKYVKNKDVQLFEETHKHLFHYFTNELKTFKATNELTLNEVNIITYAFHHAKEFMTINELFTWFTEIIERYFTADRFSQFDFLIGMDHHIQMQWRELFINTVQEFCSMIIREAEDITLLYPFTKRYADFLKSNEIDLLVRKLEDMNLTEDHDKSITYNRFCQVLLKYTQTWNLNDVTFATEASTLWENNKEKFEEYLTKEDLILLYFEDFVTADIFGFDYSPLVVENGESIISLAKKIQDTDDIDTLTKLKMGLVFFKLGMYYDKVTNLKRKIVKRDPGFYKKRLEEYNAFLDRYSVNECHDLMLSGLKILRENVNIIQSYLYFFEYQYIKFLVNFSFDLSLIEEKIEKLLRFHNKSNMKENHYFITKTLVNTFYDYINYYNSINETDDPFKNTYSKLAFVVFANEYSSHSNSIDMSNVFNDKISVQKFFDDANIMIQDSNSEPPLFFAIKMNDTELVHYLIRNGHDVKSVIEQTEGQPIRYALESYNEEMIKLLINQGISIEVVLNNLKEIKITNESRPVLLYLVENMNLDQCNNSKLVEELMIECVVMGDIEFLTKIFHKNGIEKLMINYGQILMKSISTFRPDLVTLLLEHGADPCWQDELGNSPLLISIFNQQTDIAEVMIKFSKDLNVSNYSGLTPLLQAISNQDHSMVKELLQNGADIDKPYSDGKTPIQLAIANKDKDITLILLNYHPDINKGNCDGYSTLILSVINFDVDMVKRILKLHPRLDYQCGEGHTALHHSIIKNKPNISLELLKSNLDLSLKDKGNNSYLFYSILTNNYQVTRRLIQKGADVNTRNINGMSLMQTIAQLPNPDIRIVNLLLSNSYVLSHTDVQSLKSCQKTNIINLLKKKRLI